MNVHIAMKVRQWCGVENEESKHFPGEFAQNELENYARVYRGGMAEFQGCDNTARIFWSPAELIDTQITMFRAIVRSRKERSRGYGNSSVRAFHVLELSFIALYSLTIVRRKEIRL